jgi:hypothetical protein
MFEPTNDEHELSQHDLTLLSNLWASNSTKTDKRLLTAHIERIEAPLRARIAELEAQLAELRKPASVEALFNETERLLRGARIDVVRLDNYTDGSSPTVSAWVYRVLRGRVSGPQPSLHAAYLALKGGENV